MNDGNSTPETFDPTCNLKFDLLARGAGNRNIFGWYNVTPDPENAGKTPKPDNEDLYTFILASEDPSDPGDPVFSRELAQGRRQLRGRRHRLLHLHRRQSSGRASAGLPPTATTSSISEKAFNPDSDEDDPYIHLIIWQSVTFRNSFYFGWEDLLTGNDNDFDDILTRVSGITCSGGGEVCETGQEGVCADGTMQCQQGELSCVPNASPSDEKCDALDNDCDGETDEGDDLCDAGLVCDRGKCVPPCGSGEFPCTAGFVCSAAGTCVDPLCEGVDCDPRSDLRRRRVHRRLQGRDLSVRSRLPPGRVCGPVREHRMRRRLLLQPRRCVDCDCKGCDDGFTCPTTSAWMIPARASRCDAGAHCIDGDCVDNCDGAECPGGAERVDGACMPPGSVNGAGGEGNGDGEGGDDGGGVVITGGSSSGGSSSGGSSSGGSDSGGSLGDDDGSVEAKGCGCRTVGGGKLGASTALLAAAGALGLALRRRRRSGAEYRLYVETSRGAASAKAPFRVRAGFVQKVEVGNAGELRPSNLTRGWSRSQPACALQALFDRRQSVTPSPISTRGHS